MTPAREKPLSGDGGSRDTQIAARDRYCDDQCREEGKCSGYCAGDGDPLPSAARASELPNESKRSYNRELVHGTVSGYNYRGCRCESCRDAQRRYYGKKSMAEHLAEIEPEHGTEGRYTHWLCRCDVCKAAAAKRRRERRYANPEARERENRKRMERYYRQKEAQSA